MKIAVVGSGGREHALVWKLSQTDEVIAVGGNPGMTVECEPADTDLVSLARERSIHLVVFGPETPLVEGKADPLRAAGVPVFGPNADGARLEGSKAFCKAMMQKAGIPTARFGSFTDAGEAKAFAATLSKAVIKASGNAFGKGVIVCDDLAEAQSAIDDMLVSKKFGDAGSEIVVEERLTGPEFSLLTLVSGTHYQSLPVAQDYKRAYDNDQGPNTGGMGSVCRSPWVTEQLIKETEATIVEPLLELLAKEGIDYRGALFSGILVQDGKPYCLEYNVRFGDPETQSVMAIIGPEFAIALYACAVGQPIPTISASDKTAVTVVVAAEGYPESPRKGDPITLSASPDALIFHAGTKSDDGLITNGGRVFSVTGVGDSLEAARSQAYKTAAEIRFSGAWFRKDIGR